MQISLAAFHPKSALKSRRLADCWRGRDSVKRKFSPSHPFPSAITLPPSSWILAKTAKIYSLWIFSTPSVSLLHIAKKIKKQEKFKPLSLLYNAIADKWNDLLVLLTINRLKRILRSHYLVFSLSLIGVIIFLSASLTCYYRHFLY